MRTKRFLAATGVGAALVAGGVAGLVLGVPGVSGAQTDAPTTIQPADPNPPSTEAPAPRERGDGHCVKDGEDSGRAPSGMTQPARFLRL